MAKLFARGRREVVALQDVDLDVHCGESLAVMGPSGSGKSTLLSVLGCLDRPSAGEYWLEGERVAELDDRRLSRLRNRRVGFVFQSFHLIPHLTVAENVETPLLYGDVSPSAWAARVKLCLEAVGLAHRAHHRPSELSGGEAQRAAVARALVMDPALLLADEPTGNLDTATGERIVELLAGLNREGRTLVLVTHDERLARRMQRAVILRDGRIVGEEGAAG